MTKEMNDTLELAQAQQTAIIIDHGLNRRWGVWHPGATAFSAAPGLGRKEGDA